MSSPKPYKDIFCWQIINSRMVFHLDNQKKMFKHFLKINLCLIIPVVSEKSLLICGFSSSGSKLSYMQLYKSNFTIFIIFLKKFTISAHTNIQYFNTGRKL